MNKIIHMTYGFVTIMYHKIMKKIIVNFKPFIFFNNPFRSINVHKIESKELMKNTLYTIDIK